MRLVSAVLLASSTLALSLTSTVAWSQARIFCCDDAQGRKVCSDFLPPECAKRAYEERDEKGFIVSRKEAPLTAEQQARREAELARKLEDERKKTEERRRNLALLSTYATETEIDTAKARAVTEIQKQVTQAEKQLEESTKNRARVEKEKEFYANKPLPPQLKKQIQDADADIKAKQDAVAARKADIGKAQLRFEEERKKFRELKGIVSPGPALTEPLPPTPPDAPAAPAGNAPAAPGAPQPPRLEAK